MTSKASLKAKREISFVSTRLTDSEIESLRADKKATLVRLRELRAKENAEQEKAAAKAKAAKAAQK